MPILIYSEDQEYANFKSLLRVAILKHTTYKGEYIKCVVENAKIMSTKKQVSTQIDPDIYKYSMALSKMNSTDLMSIQTEKIGRYEFEQILKFFESL